ncbi:DgyrCDS3042 [Dimorphilus gyrociliatus]|uniref:DgyrCDS3042 n=1 Tax=Dimorphilus gyrociliatus TaxID=2664684 RepID=A0A7I8VCE3_9ANNE|nr:DgyrCDS3042 [Dimorphilus gyrociliatus]
MSQDSDSNAAAPQVKNKKVTKSSPTHFLAVQINNQEIIQKLANIQNEIKQKLPVLEKVMVLPSKSHVTLFVMHLPNENDIEKAKEVLSSFEKFPESLQFTVQNINNFGKNVVFADINKDNDDFNKLKTLRNDLKNHFEENGLNVSGKQEFQPHLTIMKISKAAKKYQKKLKYKIPEESWIKYKEDEINFGVERVDTIQLNSMSGTNEDGTYYFVEKEVKLKNDL